MVYHKIFPAEIDSLYEMLEYIEVYAQKRRISVPILEKIILATEEAFINIISYGYPGKKKGTIEISCSPTTPKSGIRIVIKDRGVPFNPIESNAQEESEEKEDHQNSRSNPLEEKKEEALGGYGILILIGVMDRVEYKRIDGGNRLTLIKYF